MPKKNKLSSEGVERIQCVYNIASMSLTYMIPYLEDPEKEEAGRMEELEDREKGSQMPPTKHNTAMVVLISAHSSYAYKHWAHTTLALLITNCKEERFSQG